MISVLFARLDSIYKSLPECDVWDMDRDARKWPGGNAVIAHPPCRAWGTLRHMAKPRDDEKELAVFAVAMVRKWGGVLEHPKRSTLWDHCGLPKPGYGKDEYGGFSIGVPQQWFGHQAEKMTLLYIVGTNPKELPTIPLSLDYAEYVVGTPGSRKNGKRYKHAKEITKSNREHTPLPFAQYLYDIAMRCNP